MMQSKEKLNTTIELTGNALQRANKVYDEILTLFANVTALNAPEINLEKLKKDASAANKEAQRLQDTINELAASNDKLLNEYDDNSELGKLLIAR